jgi:hypothetical protein
MFMTEESFDWSPLGEAFWTEAAATTGATLLQAKFACCRHRGMTATGAARLAGYTDTGDGIRQAGSRAAKSTAVLNLMALAVAESGGGDDGLVDGAEARRILSRLARGSDPNVRIKALESLNKMERDERAAVRREEDVVDPVEEIRNLICLVPEVIGPAFAAGLWFDRVGRIDGFPFLREVGPVLASQLPGEWRRWRGDGPNPYLDGIAAGPLLTPEQLLAAVRSTRPEAKRHPDARPKPAAEPVAEEEANDAPAA